MIELTSQTIPGWFVALCMIYTGIIWLVTRNVEIRMDSRAFSWTFIIEGFVYAIVFAYLKPDIELRGFLSRFMIVFICFSQSFPLTISYIRSLKRGRDS